MLEVRIDYIPHGVEPSRREIKRFTIVNIGDHLDRPDKGNYVCLHEGGSFRVEDHDRAEDAWALVRKCIDGYLN